MAIRTYASVLCIAVAFTALAMSPALGDSIDYTYDATGRLKSATYSSGQAVTYVYDRAGNRLSVSSTGISGVEIIPASFSASSSYMAYTGLSSPGGMRDSIFDTMGSMHGTNRETLAYIKADLGASQPVNHIAIADALTNAPGNWGPNYLNGAVVEGSTDDINWTTVATVSSVVDGVYSNYSLIGPSVRYIRLRMNNNFLGVGDFRVYRSNEIVPASFSASSSYMAYTGLTTSGGMRDSIFDTMSSMHGTNRDVLAYIEADLGSLQVVDRIMIADAPTNAPGNWGPSYLNGAIVERSTDNINWTTVSTVASVVDGVYQSYSFGGVSVRYIRLRMNNNFLGMGDFRVYAR